MNMVRDSKIACFLKKISLVELREIVHLASAMGSLQTVLPFKLAATDESLTAHSGLALIDEYLRAMGVRELIDHELPRPGSATAGYEPSAHVLPLDSPACWPDTDEFYVLDAQPRSKNKFLFRGHIWVNARDFAITRVEGEPAVNPSWWTVKTDFNRRYQKIGDFWLPESNESETKVRILGTAVLSIEYRDYQIMQAGGATVASPNSEAPAATIAEKF